MRTVFQWSLGKRALELGKRTLIMGVVNVTPDSFSDGGLYLDSAKASAHAVQLLEEGADIIDVGGESTRPGASVAAASPLAENRNQEAKLKQEGRTSKVAVTVEEELRRVLPVIAETKTLRPSVVISIDTYKASVARAAVAAGAEIVNDVSGLRWDPEMAKTLAGLQCGVVLMHMRGRPEDWHSLPPPTDVVMLVKRELRDSADKALMAGIKRERLAVDPGFGFGKNFEE